MNIEQNENIKNINQIFLQDTFRLTRRYLSSSTGEIAPSPEDIPPFDLENPLLPAPRESVDQIALQLSDGTLDTPENQRLAAENILKFGI
jgi:hypothetical protein